MDLHLWSFTGLYLINLLFATAEASAQLISKHKVQVLVDKLREKPGIRNVLIPKSAGALRSSLTTGKLLSLVAVIPLFVLYPFGPLPTQIGIGAGLLLLSLYIPMAVAYRSPRAVLSLLLPLLRIFNVIVLPISRLRDMFFNKFRSRARRSINGDEDAEGAQELEAYIDEAEEEGLFEPAEAEMVRQVVEFSDTVVKEIMTPRMNMECVELGMCLRDFSARAAEEKFSRYPVIDGKIDNVVGIAHIKSLLDFDADELRERFVDEIMTPTHFVPESKKISSLLRYLQTNKIQMAVVVDEYGGTAGLITLEDILEEIVGEIEDEHDEEESSVGIKRNQDGSFNVAGTVDVSEVEKILEVDMDDKSYETVSGLALNHLKHIPKIGEEFVTEGGIKVEIVDADERNVFEVRLSRLEKNE